MYTETEENENCLRGREKKLSSAQKQRMRCLCGDDSSMEAANAVSTAPYSEMRETIDPAILYARRMQSLIASGLVAGITPLSTRRQSPQATLDFAFSKLDGGEQDEQPAQD